MQAIRKAIKHDGTWLIADVHGQPTFEQNLNDNPLAPVMYGFSVLCCMSSALSEPGGLGLGTLGFPRTGRAQDDGGGGVHALHNARFRKSDQRVLRGPSVAIGLCATPTKKAITLMRRVTFASRLP